MLERSTTPPVSTAAGRTSRPSASSGRANCAAGQSCDCTTEAAELLDAVQTNPWGTVSPSIYETARLVALAPWLNGHNARIIHLLDQQHTDGGWGGVDAYALVPTLSATEALLAVMIEPSRRRMPDAVASRVTSAADRGLARSHRLLGSVRVADLPDTPAIEIIVPFLVVLIQHHLDGLRDSGVTGLDRWRGDVRLPLPEGVDDQFLRTVQAILDTGRPVPLKMLHSLEVAGHLATGARGVPKMLSGTVGASPAATAAWLGAQPTDRATPAARYLRAAAAKHGGPVPSVLPITSFERAWVINSVAMAGIKPEPSRRLLREMLGSVGRQGVAGGSGLPPDADTTSATLSALGHVGVPTSLGVLRRFDLETHFCTWVGERTASATTNAHVLAALSQSHGRRSAWRISAMRRTAAWLCDQQSSLGAWSDKWHASPYYATVCGVTALRDMAERPAASVDSVDIRADVAISRAAAWVLGSQRRDGSWGRWAGTAEETAYALQILLYRARPDRPSLSAAAKGYRFLVEAQDAPMTPLWHDKDLYTPTLVVRAAILSARHLGRAVPGLSQAARPGVRAIPRPRRTGLRTGDRTSRVATESNVDGQGAGSVR